MAEKIPATLINLPSQTRDWSTISRLGNGIRTWAMRVLGILPPQPPAPATEKPDPEKEKKPEKKPEEKEAKPEKKAA